MIIPCKNTLASSAQKTFLTHTEAAGATALRWKNPNAFSASWGIQIGETGHEQTEIRLLGTSAVAGTAGTITVATLYEHQVDTPIYATKYDQVVFEVSTDGTAGTASPIADGTVTIQADSDYTQFDHTSGSASYAYKTYFRNSVLNVTSTESDWIVGTVPFYTLQAIRQRAKDKMWDASFVKDEQYDDWINEWKDEMNNALVDVDEDYALGSVNVSYSGTADLGTITNTDFKSIVRVWTTTNGSDWYKATKMGINKQNPNQEFYETAPYFYMYGDRIIGRQPHSSSGTAAIIYSKIEARLSNDMDELPVPMWAYTKSFVDYCLSQAYYKDGKTEIGDRYEAKANAAKDRFKKDLTPRLRTGADYIDIVEDLGQSGEGNLEII